MSSSAFPLNQIVAVNTLSNLSAEPVGGWFKVVSTLYALPKMAAFIASTMTNDKLSKMSQEDASEAYLPLASVHRALLKVIDDMESKHPWMARTILRWWIRSMTTHTKRIGDVAEALAWSADANLRDRLARSVHQIEQKHLEPTR